MENKLNQSANRKHFVLVHDAGHGAWCWYNIRCLLENAGHKVTCLDLTSCGVDPTDASSILNFEEYNKPLTDFFSGQTEDDDKVVLVGQSAGGLSVTRAVQQFRRRIAMAIYVAAVMQRNGSSAEDTEAAAPQFSKHGDIDDMRTPDGVLKEEYQRKILYNTSPRKDQILASMLLRPSPPPAVFQESQFCGDEDVDEVTRIYVKTLQDHVFSPAQQDMMINLWPPAQVFTLDSDHSPFFSAPDELCEVLCKVSGSTPNEPV